MLLRLEALFDITVAIQLAEESLIDKGDVDDGDTADWSSTLLRRLLLIEDSPATNDESEMRRACLEWLSGLVSEKVRVRR